VPFAESRYWVWVRVFCVMAVLQADKNYSLLKYTVAFVGV